MSLRRTRPFHYVMAVIVGVASGKYIFEEPLKKRAGEQRTKDSTGA